MNNEGLRFPQGRGVACRLVVDGKVIEFVLPGPLVSMAPAPEKTKKGGRKA